VFPPGGEPFGNAISAARKALQKNAGGRKGFTDKQKGTGDPDDLRAVGRNLPLFDGIRNISTEKIEAYHRLCILLASAQIEQYYTISIISTINIKSSLISL
jgi:hypothetical protein